MGRKNRKGRTSDQHPRRFYRSSRRGRRRRGEDWLAPESDSGRDPAAAADPEWMPYPELDYQRPTEPFRHDERPKRGRPLAGMRDLRQTDVVVSAAVSVCGRCTEWVAREDSVGLSDRGECLHPASGIAYPPVDTPACPYFH